MLESSIFKDMFGTAAMRAVFDDTATVYRYTETEIALAQVQGRLGVIPAKAAQVIAQKADSTKLDMVELKRETEIVGYPILPLVHQLSKMCGPEGEYLHWGATTQDIMDTATVLQVRAGLKIIETDLDELDQFWMRWPLAIVMRQWQGARIFNMPCPLPLVIKWQYGC